MSRAREDNSLVVVTGPARLGKRTKDLVRRLRRGDIAIIDHEDLDRVAAEGLVEAGVAAVVNCSPSISGRYPNLGPQVVVEAGIPLLDLPDAAVFDGVAEGDAITIRSDVLVAGEAEFPGMRLSVESVTAAMEVARASIGTELRSFAVNTLEYVGLEAEAFFEPVDLPPLRTDFRGRHALVVVRGHDYRHDLKALRPYIREYQPVLVAVDGGADALVEVGLTPDVIIGDFDSVSEPALHLAKDLVHHVHRDGRAPGRENLIEWDVPYQEFVSDGMSEDVAMLLAYEAGATLIVAVGTHSTMVEMLDKGRKGMASTFLTRLRLGPVLVDAKGVNRLYEGRVRRRDIAFLVLAAVAAIVVVSVVSEPIHVFVDGIRFTLRDIWFTVRDWFTP
ncbi:MAG: putative cytokinetic ring protein SteA [Acidimicrobiia bacterium]